MHFPKPFFRPKKNRWYVQFGGKLLNLGPNRDEAFRRYHQVMGERKQPIPIVTPSSDPTLLSILDGFLDWCLKHRERRTYDAYKREASWAYEQEMKCENPDFAKAPERVERRVEPVVDAQQPEAGQPVGQA